MGEIIRKIESINIRNTSFDIELNKSSDKSSYRDIHIQNDMFRFEMKEDEFIKIAASIIYAHKQLTNIKKKQTVTLCENVHIGDYLDPKNVCSFFRELNNEEIKYFIEKNIEDEIPDRLIKGKDVDIIVATQHMKKMREFLKKNNFHKIEHPKSSNNGYYYAYGLNEPTMWKNEESGLIIDLADRLMVNSLTAYTVVPLNEDINCSAWENAFYDTELAIWRMGKIEEIVYLIARAIFNKHGFSEKYVREIEKNKDLLKTDVARMLLRNITFSFTEVLLQHIERGDYSTIVEEYWSFVNY